MILLILKKKENREKIKKIIFASKAIKNTYQGLIKNNNTEIIVKKNKFFVLSIFKTFVFSFLVFLIIKILKPKKKLN